MKTLQEIEDKITGNPKMQLIGGIFFLVCMIGILMFVFSQGIKNTERFRPVSGSWGESQ